MAGMETAIGLGSAVGYSLAAGLSAARQNFAILFGVEFLLRLLACLCVLFFVTEQKRCVEVT